MKKIMLIPMTISMLIACNPNQQQAKEEKPADSSAAVQKMAVTYPFSHKYSINWQPGDDKITLMVLETFKKYVDGDVAGAMENFGDTIELNFDYYHYRGPRDSVKAMFTAERANMATDIVEHDTWLGAYYPDYKATWVTMWYKEKWTDKKGKMDSAYHADDIMVKDGKILEIDGKMRHFPKPQKKM